ncbi:MAG: threonine synthase [Desulfobacter sp.]
MMIRFISTRGNTDPVGFDTAVLQGFAPDGGLYVPDRLPRFTPAELARMKELPYTALCITILSRFIDPGIIPANDLKELVRQSFSTFSHPDIVPLVPCPGAPAVSIMELFHGPTLSFKDIAMGFLVRVMDYLLEKDQRHLNLILATTGDTGPAAAHAASGLNTIDCWPLFPKGMITPEQERQMTGLAASNIHPVGVTGCPDGGDDLDRVVLNLFNDTAQKQRLRLSSVNSINWCRVMVQSAHYFYAYFRACNRIGDPVVFSVPSGAFGNLFAGYLAREMGLPAVEFICAVNANQTLYQAFTRGVFKHHALISTCSSAIDIVVPYNFWRFLYFAAGRDAGRISAWMDEFDATGEIALDAATRQAVNKGVTCVSITDRVTLETMNTLFASDPAYLSDPHGAVALAAALAQQKERADTPIVCLATAHPAKFPETVLQALDRAPGTPLPRQARHASLAWDGKRRENLAVQSLDRLEAYLVRAVASVRETPPKA